MAKNVETSESEELDSDLFSSSRCVGVGGCNCFSFPASALASLGSSLQDS